MGEIYARRIEYASKEYEEELCLRDDLLRKPLGLDLFSEDLSGEDKDIHIGAFYEAELVGVLVLSKIDKHSVRMKQVAVKQDMQGKGVGRSMVDFCETQAAAARYRKIILHARKTAVEFYLKLGYTVEGEEFFEVGIPHMQMSKVIPVSK